MFCNIYLYFCRETRLEVVLEWSVWDLENAQTS